MIDWSSIFYVSITSMALMLSLLGLGAVVILPGIGRIDRRFFLVYFMDLMACCLVTIIDFSLYGHLIPKTVAYLLLVSECLLLSLPLPMVTFYLLHRCREDMRRSRLIHTVLGLWMVFFILLLGSKYTGIFSYVASDNCYGRGPFIRCCFCR